MTVPYRARVNERTLLNLPGFHSGAFVYVSVEDTSQRGLQHGPYCEPGCLCGCAENYEPRTTLEIADCDEVISLEFDIDSEGYRENSLHKLDTLIAALRVFREALVEEFEPYDERARALAELQRLEDVQDEPPGGATSCRPGPPDTVAEGRGARLQSAYTAVRVCPVSFRKVPRCDGFRPRSSRGSRSPCAGSRAPRCGAQVARRRAGGGCRTSS